MTSPTPEPTREEAIARAAAEAALASMPDYGAQIAALASRLEDLAALITAPPAERILAEVEAVAGRLDVLESAAPAYPDPTPALEAVAGRLDVLESAAPAYPDPTPALEDLGRAIDDLKLASLERNAG